MHEITAMKYIKDRLNDGHYDKTVAVLGKIQRREISASMSCFSYAYDLDAQLADINSQLDHLSDITEHQWLLNKGKPYGIWKARLYFKKHPETKEYHSGCFDYIMNKDGTVDKTVNVMGDRY